MEAKAHARFQRYGATKVAQVLTEVRGKTVAFCDGRLPFVERKAVELVRKTIDSAAANLAVRLGRSLDPKQVWVKEAWATQGPMGQMVRVRPAPMGRAMTITRKVCHLTVVVTDEKVKAKKKKGKRG